VTDFRTASAVEPLGDARYRATIPDGWQMGRGTFGGLLFGAMLRAVEHAEPDRPARTLSGDVCGPVVPGDVEIAVRVLRRGNSQSNLAAELRQNGEILATATVVSSAARKIALPAPPLDTPLETAPGPPALPPSAIRAVFTQNYLYRSDAPFGGTVTPSGLIVENTPLAAVDAAALIGRLDAWWPAAFGLPTGPRPMATISFTAQILVDPSTLPPDEPLRYRARIAALHDGFSVELRELWHGGRPIALNQQTFAVLA
jgi:hypothetical protein